MMGAALNRIAAVVGGLLTIGAVTAAHAADVTNADRSFKNYTRDAAGLNEGQFRFELQGATLHDENNDITFKTSSSGVTTATRPAVLNLAGFRTDYQSLSGGNFNLQGSYGLSKNVEVGLIMPFFVASTQPLTNNQYSTSSYTGDAGDLLLFGKFSKEVAERCSLAGGLEVSAPSGNEDKGFGTGNTGMNPFVSTRYTYKGLGVGGHVGYQLFTGDTPDVFNWSFEMFLRGGPTYVFRTEVTGRLFQQRGSDNNDVTLWPGIDFNFSDHLTIRPTGMTGLTGVALDWGVALGLAYSL